MLSDLTVLIVEELYMAYTALSDAIPSCIWHDRRTDERVVCFTVHTVALYRMHCGCMMMMMFIGTETLVTQLVHEISRMQAC